MTYTIEYEQEEDGRWLAEVLELPGVLVYDQTAQEAISRAQALALRVLAALLRIGWTIKRTSDLSRTASCRVRADRILCSHSMMAKKSGQRC